jgi:hypothetical protein
MEVGQKFQVNFPGKFSDLYITVFSVIIKTKFPLIQQENSSILSLSFVPDMGNLILAAAVGNGIVIYDFENEKVKNFPKFFFYHQIFYL